MKFSILQEELKQGINTIYRFVSPRPQIPILSHILISIERGRVRITTTNLESGINYWLGAKIEEEGKTTVPAKILLEVVDSLPPSRIDIKESKGVINLICEDSLVNIPTTPPNDFPNVPYEIPQKSTTLPREVFGVITKQISFTAATNDDVKPEYTGVLFIPQKEGLVLVATDGVRLSQKQIKTNISFPTKVLIPARIVNEIPKIFGHSSQRISTFFNTQDNQILFGIPEVVLTSKLLDAERFPDFEKIIPTSWATRVLLNKEDILAALRLSSVFAKDQIVKFTFNASQSVLSSEDPQTGAQTTNLKTKLEGEEMSISFNWRFINEFLSAVEGEEVEFHFVNPTSPGVFLDPKDESYLHLIMPVRTQG